MIVLDTNTFLLLIVGSIDPKRINKYKVTSIFNESDYLKLLHKVEDLSNLIILPNIWTEIDSLLNKSTGTFKDNYITLVRKISKDLNEHFISAVTGF